MLRTFSLILSALALLFVLSEAEAVAASNISFDTLSQQYSQAQLPTTNDLLNHAWGFAAVVGNPKLALNQDASDRVDLSRGLKNGDGSQMYLWFRNDAPQSMYPFLAMDRYNAGSSSTSILFNRVDQDIESKNITYYFDAGANDGTYYTNQCRVSSLSQETYLLCQVTYIISSSAVNPIYKQPKYQEANGKVVVFQIFKRDLQ